MVRYNNKYQSPTEWYNNKYRDPRLIRNVGLGLGAVALAGVAGYGVYKEIKRIRKKPQPKTSLFKASPKIYTPPVTAPPKCDNITIINLLLGYSPDDKSYNNYKDDLYESIMMLNDVKNINIRDKTVVCKIGDNVDNIIEKINNTINSTDPLSNNENDLIKGECTIAIIYENTKNKNEYSEIIDNLIGHIEKTLLLGYFHINDDVGPNDDTMYNLDKLHFINKLHNYLKRKIKFIHLIFKINKNIHEEYQNIFEKTILQIYGNYFDNKNYISNTIIISEDKEPRVDDVLKIVNFDNKRLNIVIIYVSNDGLEYLDTDSVINHIQNEGERGSFEIVTNKAIIDKMNKDDTIQIFKTNIMDTIGKYLKEKHINNVVFNIPKQIDSKIDKSNSISDDEIYHKLIFNDKSNVRSIQKQNNVSSVLTPNTINEFIFPGDPLLYLNPNDGKPIVDALIVYVCENIDDICRPKVTSERGREECLINYIYQFNNFNKYFSVSSKSKSVYLLMGSNDLNNKFEEINFTIKNNINSRKKTAILYVVPRKNGYHHVKNGKIVLYYRDMDKFYNYCVDKINSDNMDVPKSSIIISKYNKNNLILAENSAYWIAKDIFRREPDFRLKKHKVQIAFVILLNEDTTNNNYLIKNCKDCCIQHGDKIKNSEQYINDYTIDTLNYDMFLNNNQNYKKIIEKIEMVDTYPIFVVPISYFGKGNKFIDPVMAEMEKIIIPRDEYENKFIFKYLHVEKIPGGRGRYYDYTEQIINHINRGYEISYYY